MSLVFVNYAFKEEYPKNVVRGHFLKIYLNTSTYQPSISVNFCAQRKIPEWIDRAKIQMKENQHFSHKPKLIRSIVITNF